MTERRWRVRVLFTFRGRPKTPTTDAAPGALAISTQVRRSCRPVWANDALDHARDSRAAGCPDEEWEQDATMKATLHERDADHDELLRRVQVQPDDVADQRRPQALEFLRRDRSVPGIQPYLVQNLGIHWTPSGTFLASELLSGKRAGQDLFSGWAGVLPKSSPRGVGVESEDVVEAFLGGVGVGEDALRAGSAFVSGGVQQDSFLDAGEVGQKLPDAEVQPGLVGLAAHQVGDGQGQDTVEDVDPDLGLGPVEHRGEPDDVGVFELAEP